MHHVSRGGWSQVLSQVCSYKNADVYIFTIARLLYFYRLIIDNYHLNEISRKTDDNN